MSSPCGSSSVSEKTTNDITDNVEIKYASAAKETIKPIHITDKQFDGLIKSKKPVLVDFWASWCAPCRQLGPVIDELALEYKDQVIIAKMDVQNNPQTPKKYKIRGIPTIMIFQDGQLRETVVGLHPKSTYKKVLDKLVKTSTAKQI